MLSPNLHMNIKSFLKIFSKVDTQSILSTYEGYKIILKTIWLIMRIYYPFENNFLKCLKTIHMY